MAITHTGTEELTPLKDVWNLDGKFDTNNTSAPDGIVGMLSTVSRAAVGEFTLTFESYGNELLSWKFDALSELHEVRLKSETLSTNGQCVIQVRTKPVKAVLAAAITCTAKANYVDGENMVVLTDEYGSTYTFEADPAADGVTAGSIAVDISGDTSAADVGTTLAALIVTNCPFLSVTDNLDGTIDLEHKVAGTAGNSVTLTENVTNGGHVVASPLAGGVADAVADTTDVAIYASVKMIRSKLKQYGFNA